MRVDHDFVTWFRSVAPYVNSFRNKTFVVAFGGEVVADGKFVELVHDLNSLWESDKEWQDKDQKQFWTGNIKTYTRNGKVWGERHRFDNRHTMAVLTRLDRSIAANPYDRVEIRIVAENFEEFLDIVCSGDAKAAADFIEARRRTGRA